MTTELSAGTLQAAIASEKRRLLTEGNVADTLGSAGVVGSCPLLDVSTTSLATARPNLGGRPGSQETSTSSFVCTGPSRTSSLLNVPLRQCIVKSLQRARA